MANQVQYIFDNENLNRSAPQKFRQEDLKHDEMIVNIGPQHPSTHGVLRLEVVTSGEQIVEVVPHLGYLHRCFEKHAENLPYNQTLPFTDRMDYLAAMNNEHSFAMGVERMLGIDKDIPKRVEYIRVVVAELNRLASHFVALGSYGMDIGAVTAFFWMMRDREHILRLLEWVSGARMLYNYIWVGGLFYDLPVGFEERCLEFVQYLKPKLKELENVVIDNAIFVNRTANVGVLPVDLAINYGITGPMLRGSGLKYDLRKVDAYSVYPEIDFEIPVGKGQMGQLGDCWDRTWVRVQECYESIRIIEQSLEKLTKEHKRDRDFDPHAMVPKKIRPKAQDLYVRAENPKGETGFYFRADGRSDIPFRCKARGASFVNLSIINELAKGGQIADLIAVIGSIDIVLGEVDR
ncbi:MAG: NADH-quinone oxidoreductase subunit D [Roseivirga sp.]|nr:MULTISPECIES: NADH-quinone oxidoreductase subunit D [Roseivirga]MBO6496732.1 NADH-quinone oxidoreductase subunit D [Roseivirga sp.]MBO6660796.1 NADH-quinone oxidoreductase subunit D [Roseivirga sp.]MBO6761986.1 NADH-quinone oxidoreductase subunit D [Roseivirga sp.]MBO6909220.1 NADH-quinone oxidoreductase subunit D [Roseivirga sp.]WPZ12124.1 NADH-quinone oxidoreductase subunit D [Roseivirga spongicola]